MIKIVTIDLDGTLFDKKKNISNVNKEALRKARELGVKIVIATGRPLQGVTPVLEELGLTTKDDYVIIYNGSKVFNVGTNEIVFSSSITGKEVKELYAESKRLGVCFHAFRLNEELITDKHNPYTNVEATINHIEDHLYDISLINDNDLFLKAMLVDEKEKLDMCEVEVNPKFPREMSMVRSAKIFLEFLNKTSDKGKALIQLANYLNVDIKDTMAIGDMGNDLSMILTAGVGVCMENGDEKVKMQADFVTKTNEENGVAYAIEKYILNV